MPVWDARERSTRREVIVKYVDFGALIEQERTRTPLDQRFAPLLTRFVTDVAALQRIAHPGIASVLDADLEDGVAWLAMERREGTSLAEATVAPSEAVRLVVTLLHALDALHTVGLCHGAIASDDVWLAADGARLIVFDVLARQTMGRMVQMANETRAGGLRTSTLRWMIMQPMERLASEQPSAAADVYSAALLLVQLLTGHTPRPSDLGEAMSGLLTAPSTIERIPDARVVGLLRHCVAQDPAARPTARALAASLAALT